MTNPITDALESLQTALQAALGAGVVVSRNPGVIGPQVASTGVAVLVGPGVAREPSSFKTWFLEVPVHVCFDSPADPNHMDPAYGVAHALLDSDYVVVAMDAGTVNLDSGMSLPAITVTLQTTTECP